MKKTLHIDEALLAEAKAACGATTDTDTVRLGLEALVRRAASQRLRPFSGPSRMLRMCHVGGKRPLVKRQNA